MPTSKGQIILSHSVWKIKSITKKLQVAHSHIFGLVNEWTTQNSSLDIMKILIFWGLQICTYWKNRATGQGRKWIRFKLEENLHANFRVIFYLRLWPKIGHISTPTHALHLLCSGGKYRDDDVNDFNDKMVLTPNKSILHAFWTVCTFSNNASIWRYLAFLEIFWMTLGSLQIMWTIWRLD